MFNKPQITIGIPVFNEEGFLEKTIKSVLYQSYKNFRLLISDNCSTDASYNIAQKYASLDDRIILTRQKNKITTVHNFTFLLNETNTKYFVWLGAHDILLKDYIKKAIDLLESEPSIVLAYPKAVFIDSTDKIIRDIIVDYDTAGMPLNKRLYKIANNFTDGYVIHGVFKTEIAKKLPFETIPGPDHLVVFSAAAYGYIVKLKMTGLQRRMIRKETLKEQHQRHYKEGVFKRSAIISPYDLFALKHYEFVWSISELKVFNKIDLTINLQRIFSRKFGVSVISLTIQVFINLMLIFVRHFLKQKKKVEGEASLCGGGI